MTKRTEPEAGLRSRDSVLRDVKQIMSDYVAMAPEDIHGTSNLLTDLGCDSLDIVEITMEIEEQFDVSVPDDLAERIRTVGDIADGVAELLGRNAGDLAGPSPVV
jgi:acyl carrier protein